MQRLSRFSLAVAAAVLLVAHSPGAWSAEPQHIAPCGATSSVAIAAAEKALRSGRDEDERAALLCVVQALQTVETRLKAVEAGNKKPKALIAPNGAWRNQP
jgi:hypothetical protein